MGHANKTEYSLIGVPWTEMSFANVAAVVAASPGLHDSTYTESNLEMDAPVPSGVYPVDLIAGGNPSATISWTINAKRSGYPGPGDGGTFEYVESSTNIGWTFHRCNTGFETISPVSTSAANEYLYPRVAATSDGRAHAVVQYNSNASNETITYFQRSNSTEVWGTGVTVWTTGSVTGFGTAGGQPEIVVVPQENGTERLVVASLEDISSTGRLRLDYSDDAGTTWTNAGRNLLTMLSGTIDQLRMVYDPISGNYLLAYHRNNAGTHTAPHYTSSDGGATWVLTETISDVRQHDLAIVCGKVLYVYRDGGATYLKTTTKAAASKTFPTTAITSGTAVADSPICMAVDANRRVWIFARDNTSPRLVRRFESDTLFETLTAMTAGASSVWDDEVGGGAFTSGVYLHSACVVRGSLLISGHGVAVSGSNASTSFAMVLGGWASVTEDVELGTWNYCPIDLPANRGFTAAGAGTESLVADADGDLVLRLGTVLNGRSFTNASAIFRAKARVRVTAGGNAGADDVALRIVVVTGGNNYTGTLRFASGGGGSITLRDVNGGADRGSAAVDLSTPVDVLLVVFTSAKMSAWWKRPHGRTWTAIGTNQTVTAAGGGVAGCDWGNIAAATATSEWQWIAGDADEADLDDGQASGDRTGHPCTLDALFIDSSGFLAWRGGPVTSGQSWTVASLSRKGFRRVFPTGPTASPRIVYSATTAASTAYRAAFNLGSGSDSLVGDVIILAALNVTGIDDITLSRWDGAAYQVMASHTFYNENWQDWSRQGRVFTPNGANGTPRVYRHNELVGCRVHIIDSAAVNVWTTITRNTEGQFTNSTAAKILAIEVDETTVSGTVSSLAASSGAGAGRRFRIYWPDSCIVFAQTVTHTQRYRLSWTTAGAGTTGTFGTIAICGDALWLARQEETGSQISWISGDEQTALPGGFVSGRRIHDPIREYRYRYPELIIRPEMNWNGTVHQTTGPTSTKRAIADNNAQTLISALVGAGQYRPVVLLPQVQFDTTDPSTAQSFYGRDNVVLGYLQGGVQLTMGKGQWRSKTGISMVDTELVFRELP